MRITEKDIQKVLNRIAEQLGLATSRKEAKEKGLDSYLLVEYAACYGGYRIVTVKLENGAHYGALGEGSTCARRKAADMLNTLLSFERGLDQCQSLKAN